jgi:hypothetical protein
MLQHFQLLLSIWLLLAVAVVDGFWAVVAALVVIERLQDLL